MGAREAIDALGMLARYGAANRRTVREYVMEALCAGAEIRGGTAGYESLLESVGRDVILGGPPEETPLDFETFEYLRRVLASAAGERDGFSRFERTYDGFSPAAYEEVRDLLGPGGRRHLGIRGHGDSLAPEGRFVRAMLADGFHAELEELRAERESGEQGDQRPPWLRPLDEWAPYWPELEPLAPTPGFGLAPPGYRDDRARS